LNKINKEKLR